jgi:4a-hydroxytetrahydrobiopterin dehydratase
MPGDDAAHLTRAAISDAVTGRGWRLVLGCLVTDVPVTSTTEAVEHVKRALEEADAHGAELHVDVRHGRILLSLQPSRSGWVTHREIDAALAIADEVAAAGSVTDPIVSDSDVRSLQQVEIGIDALDISSIRPFWKAVLAYAGEGADGPKDAIVDPLGQGPAIWFQQMDQPRPQRNRLHLDISVPHDEAHARIEAALAAGGTLLSDAAAPAFWVLADREGNEACITTWQGRD